MADINFFWIAFGYILLAEVITLPISYFIFKYVYLSEILDGSTSASGSLKVMAEQDMSQVNKTAKVMKVLGYVVVYAFLILMAFIVLFPFYWMIISSLKTFDEYNAMVPTLWPQVIRLKNYSEALEAANLERVFINTIFVGVVSTALSLVITVLSAFAFARLEFKGKNALFAGLLATMMIPGELFTITNYQTIYAFGWNDTEKWGFTVLIVPVLVSVFYIYLLRQNFLQIPNELYLAAKVDGVSDIKYLWKVMIPLALPTIISITILKMMGAWNTYVWPQLVIKDPDFLLVTNGIRGGDYTLEGRGDMVNIPLQMAAVAMVSIPLFIVFICFRKYIMKGVSRSGIKG